MAAHPVCPASRSCESVTEQSKIVIVDTGSQTIGVIVDAVEEVLTVDEDQIDEAPTADHRLIDSIAKIGGRLVMVLNPPGPAVAFGAA